MAKSKSTDERVRFSFPQLAGVDQFRELVHVFGGPELVSKELRIAPELLAAYLSGDLDPPYTLMLAVYWHGPFGLSQGFSESHWSHQYNSHKRRVAEEKVERYQRFLALVAREGLIDASRCMQLAFETGVDDAWPAQPLPERLALPDAAAVAADRERRRIRREGSGRNKRRVSALSSWKAMQERERQVAANESAEDERCAA